MNESIEGKNSLAKKVSTIGACLLLGLFFGYQLYLAGADTQTTDEGVHLSAGLTYLKTNDYRYNPEHPTLTKKLAALPLLFIDIKEPTNTKMLWGKAENFFYDSWQENREYGDKLMYQSGNNADKIIFLARIGPAILALILGIAIYAFAVYLWGYWGGLLSLGLFVLDPTITAHGHLVTTDIAASLGYLLAIMTFYLFTKTRRWRDAIFFGLALGLALLSKFTLIIALPVVAAFYIAFLFSKQAPWTQSLKITFGKLLVSLAIAWAVIFAGYGFNWHLAPETSSMANSIKDSYAVASSDYSEAAESMADKAYSVLRYVLIPKDFYKGLSLVFNHVENGHSSFFLGQVSNQGWWYYFPVLFLLKTPLPTLLVIGLACILLVRDKSKRKVGTYLLAASLMFLVLAMQSHANLGLRHVLPMLPLLFVLAGGLLKNPSKKTIIFVSLMMLLLAIEFIRIQPFDMGYYNQLASGSKNGYKIATDSNLDWGQDIKRIKNYLENQKLEDVTVVYFWDGQPALDYYNVKSRSVDDFLANKSGTLIINASALTDSMYDFLDNREPDDYVSPGVLVYRFN